MKVKFVTKTKKVIFVPFTTKVKTGFTQTGSSIRWITGIKWYNNIRWWNSLAFHLKSKKVVNNG